MTEQTQPTDAELEAAWTDATGSSILPYPDDMLAFARAVLAKWGTPAGAVPTRAFLERTLAAMEGVIDVADRKTDEFDALRSCVIDLTLMLFKPEQSGNTAPSAVLPREVIRDIFMAHGFTIKEGQADLKQYVYDAADALLRAAHGIKGADHG